MAFRFPKSIKTSDQIEWRRTDSFVQEDHLPNSTIFYKRTTKPATWAAYDHVSMSLDPNSKPVHNAFHVTATIPASEVTPFFAPVIGSLSLDRLIFSFDYVYDAKFDISASHLVMHNKNRFVRRLALGGVRADNVDFRGSSKKISDIPGLGGCWDNTKVKLNIDNYAQELWDAFTVSQARDAFAGLTIQVFGASSDDSLELDFEVVSDGRRTAALTCDAHGKAGLGKHVYRATDRSKIRAVGHAREGSKIELDKDLMLPSGRYSFKVTEP